MEGAASIHGDILEAAPSELWEKASFAPTNEPSLAFLEFLWNQYALSDLFQTGCYMYSRGYVGPGKWMVFLQTSNRNYREAFLELRKDLEE